MSTCISRNGEYGSHLSAPDEFICDRCFAFDEEAAIAEVTRLRAALAARGVETAEAIAQAIEAERDKVPGPDDDDPANDQYWVGVDRGLIRGAALARSVGEQQ